ncbi:cobalt ECF transporter T component CbiQ [Methanonatronarchaeum sp. AMET-Sl]|uniref:cobalt ECF transporter T component CbiQ n=1 Tax=Methanonatronarchaeum sp. AMET-Sl TaxID=3037654 RepID=UPI00244E3A48|nr:cobalt ECF transporter T component CbiQ [Methanonatronarchaeum sp. AMET-Sl]WGI17925.1 cobalt ECF transporter T component CbiQ [Methanonatronarchaeum sp. AMET-Sl]
MKHKNLYIGGDSFLHKFNPKTKIISALILILSIVLLQNIIPLTIALSLVFTAAILSGLPIKKLLNRLKWIFMFMAAIFIFVPFFTPGETAFTILFLTATYEGLTTASIISLKMLTIMTLSMAVIMTTKFEEILRSLSELGVPKTFIEIFFLTYKYIFVIFEETEKSMMSAKSRGYQLSPKPSKLKVLGNLIGMIFVRSFDRSQRVHKAMMARGYRGKMVTTIDRNIGITNSDLAMSFSSIALAILLHLI